MNIKTFKACSLATLLLIPICSFAQEEKTKKSKEDIRLELKFKQRHSRSSNDAFADGIKIKRDLSLIKQAQEERIFDMNEIPSDDLYGGIWSNRYVNIYGSLDKIPQTYTVDLLNFTMPTLGYRTSKYGRRNRRMHHGIDLKVQIGDTIYAAFDGKVRVTAYEKRGYGYHVVLRHPNGLETVYGHLSGFLVSEDDYVKSGQPIALGGNTGRSTGSHLHFELRFLGRSINPENVIDFDKKVLYNEEYLVNTSNLGTPGQKLSRTKTYSSKSNKYTGRKVKYYRIKRGDTLYRIARANGITIQALCKLNSMSRKEKLMPGKSLRVS